MKLRPVEERDAAVTEHLETEHIWDKTQPEGGDWKPGALPEDPTPDDAA
jgi:hypothetical protein